ncbi:LOW QUALITY PROTEIN: serpin B4-like [Pollicipes pollicipes]|uniref:LOW QUALITY PROTEIN: serpin B4-like n=1 Tax=Pollicipes pollicipes TaxID=41117 RepID=UPI00188547F9|nr:LOW QUALITY PROTEIN: serpin B4-like [Pollicipes pollicipes]
MDPWSTSTSHQSKAASDLYRVLAGASADNVFLSPFSISTALSMVFGGADGNTVLQMQQALALPEDRMLQDPPDVTLNTANKLYVQNAYKILDTYSGLLEKQYLSELKSVDFGDAAGTSKLINGDVEALTKGKIKNLIDSGALSRGVRLVLVNAIYFKGSWKQKFAIEATMKRDFFISPGIAVGTDMMHLDDVRLNCASLTDIACKALELPYKGERFSMLILLPDERDGLGSLEEKLSTASIQAICAKLHNQMTMVVMPKFKLETTYDLVDHLKRLGIIDLFDANAANLSRISDTKDLSVSSVVHRAFIEVNEDGSEAAAATAMVMVQCSAPVHTYKFEFVADHPFFFAIIDSKTGLTLFSGRYIKPE